MTRFLLSVSLLLTFCAGLAPGQQRPAGRKVEGTWQASGKQGAVAAGAKDPADIERRLRQVLPPGK